MNRFPKSTTFALWLFATLLTLVAGVGATIAVAKATNSGLVGICGPYGDHADLVGWMFLGSIPVSISVGIYSAWRSYRHLTRDERKT